MNQKIMFIDIDKPNINIIFLIFLNFNFLCRHKIMNIGNNKSTINPQKFL